MDLADAQRASLAALLRAADAPESPRATNGGTLLHEASGSPPPPPPGPIARAKDAVVRFVRLHGAAVGSGPFLRGFRSLLEAQRGRTVNMAWRMDPAVLTQSGGEEWTRDAVGLLAASARRRRSLEGLGEAAAAEEEDADGSRAEFGDVLAWSLRPEMSDRAISAILAAVPSHESLEDRGGVAGAVVEAHREGMPPREVDPWVGGRGRRYCCIVPVPFWIFAVSVFCVVVLAR